MWCDIMEYYSAIKNNEILWFATTCMDLEFIIVKWVQQKEKYHLYVESKKKKKDTNELISKTKKRPTDIEN